MVKVLKKGITPEDKIWHILALALGGRTIAEWQAIMSQREFDSWVDYYSNQSLDLLTLKIAFINYLLCVLYVFFGASYWLIF